jgi:hypothetical protein
MPKSKRLIFKLFQQPLRPAKQSLSIPRQIQELGKNPDSTLSDSGHAGSRAAGKPFFGFFTIYTWHLGSIWRSGDFSGGQDSSAGDFPSPMAINRLILKGA